jgi:cell division protein DivIC
MSKKVSRNVKRRMTVIAPISIGIFVMTLFTILSYTYRINNLIISKIELEEKLQTLKDDAEIMADEIEKLKDPEYIAKYARENYLYTKDGEYVIKIQEKEKNNEEKEKNPLYIYYTIGFISILLFLLFVFIIRKNQKKNNN